MPCKSVPASGSVSPTPVRNSPVANFGRNSFFCSSVPCLLIIQVDKEWLPKIAAGDVLVAIAVTEPDTGSDVSALQTKAEPSELNGQKGWKINGAKAWSTFSGRANVLALLARTDPDMSKGAKGLSLFIVPKDSFGDEEKWEFKQESGGVIQGTNNPTPGYRGMHSYTLAIEDIWVPHSNLVGEDEGLNKGFYLQMGGFAVGRLQTGGRAVGLAQAALEKACNYVSEREQFKNKLSSPILQKMEADLTKYYKIFKKGW